MSALLHCSIEDDNGAGPIPPTGFSVDTQWASGPLGLPTRRQSMRDERSQRVGLGRMSADRPPPWTTLHGLTPISAARVIQ